jgi:RHS repeat-associated protein
MGMKIGGNYSGGFVSDKSATINTPYIFTTFYSLPAYFNITPINLATAFSADPVNMSDASFRLEPTDLSLGQTEPLGITFSRYYSPTRRHQNLANIGNGWVHSYYFDLEEISDPIGSLGGTTPAQMTPMLVATCAASALYNSQPDPKNWLVTALIAKWGIDQTINNAVSIALGNDTLEFIRQPGGSFTPTANCTWTLTNNPNYTLKQRNGNAFIFNSSKQLTSITNQSGDTLSLTYTSGKLTKVTDWKGRTLTFTYSGTPSRLASVADNSGRSVSYDYTTSADGNLDLTSVTDPESKTSTFTYDTNHQIIATKDALNRLVVTNIYDSFGHVITQYTQGDTNKSWQIYWSGWETVSQDPAGSKQRYFYDDQTRLIAQQDPLGNTSQTIYDGQNHIVMTVSPLNETNQFIYDGNHNLIYSIDALGFTNQFVYDDQNNLTRSVDPLGNPSTFGYNSQFSLTGVTNGAGDWVNYAYNSDGTLHTRTDSGGMTTYGYDSTYGQLNSITYPNSLGSEGFLNNAFGDVLSHTNARGFVTTFQYNNRRQLTNSVAPTNLVTKIAYDPVGNVAGMTDARGNTASNTWSATRHLLATTLPSTPQGVPVITNAYDSRDWLTRTVDPLQNPTLYTNDLAGRLISLTDPVQRTTTFGYDADSRKIAATNAAQEVASQQWDARGSLLKLTDGAGHFSTRAYDSAGNQVILTNRNGKKWQFQFDGANRLTNTITPLNRSTSLTFNHQGLLSTIKDPDPAHQPTSLYYDAKGRLTNRTDNVGTTRYGYDANNNLTSVTNVGQASSLSQTFDAYNRMSSFKDVYGNLIQYRYDASGNVTNLVYPGGRNVYYAFDSLNRMTNVTDWSGRKTAVTYDLGSRVKSITRPNGTYRTIGYDAAGQATNILEQTAIGFPIAFFRFNWNSAAEAQWEFAAPLPHTNTPPTRTMTYDDDNRLATVNGSSVTSDLDGNLTYAPLTNGTFATYTYDARNRLLNAGGVTNAYDPAGNRVGITYGTNSVSYVVNPNAALSQVLMRVKNGVTNYYIYGAGLLYEITETATATNTLTYHYDYRGSTIALTDGNGNVTDRMEYSAYATLTYRIGTHDTPFLFNGRYGVQTDPNGLLYMRARYYNPYLCRFVSVDPAGFAGGLNFYAAFNGNPISYLDPFGLGAVGENNSSSWLSTGWNAVTSTTMAGVQDVWNVAYTGQLNPAPGVYDAAVEAAGDYVYDSGGVRGFYLGAGINRKYPGQGSLAGQVGLTGTWTVDSGTSAEIDFGAGLQERGYNGMLFTSQTVGVGSSYKFWNQDAGFQAPSLGNKGNIAAPTIYGGTMNVNGGANFLIQNQNNAGMGINYGPVYGGLVINPSLVLQNFIDSYHIITGTSR